jgi:abequosyltransferase
MAQPSLAQPAGRSPPLSAIGMTGFIRPPGLAIRLSLCIATFNRAGYIGQTLDAVLAELTPEVELIVVDGASQDETSILMAEYVRRHPQIVYRREAENSGVDRDFDKAVVYASGQYCWLMSDDDVIVPGAIAAVLARLAGAPQLVIVNSEIRDRQLSAVLKPRQIEIENDCEYGGSEHERFFSDTGSYLSFIGGVVVRRAWWLGRERAAYFGSLFIHAGVIFQQPPPERVKVIAEPLVRVRYGNAQWSPRTFEIWIFKWPHLVWSFTHFSALARRCVSPQYPATNFKTLVWYRAIGAYGPVEWEWLSAGENRTPVHVLAGFAAHLPMRLVNAGLALYCFFSRHGDASMKLYDLARAQVASRLTIWLARRFRFPEMEK